MKSQIARVSSLIFAALAVSVVLVHPEALGSETYKVRFGGGGNAYWTGAANKYAVFNVNSNNMVTIKQTTLVSNMITGFGKWWDHEVTSSRACPLNSDGWENTDKCILGQGSVIQIPIGKSVKDYSFQFKWSEDGAMQSNTLDLKNSVPEMKK
jgi:hypothetical protein